MCVFVCVWKALKRANVNEERVSRRGVLISVPSLDSLLLLKSLRSPKFSLSLSLSLLSLSFLSRADLWLKIDSSDPRNGF